LVVKAAEERDDHDRSSRMHRLANRGVFRKSKMGTGAVVVVGVGPENLAKMGLAQDHNMI
jgi:hypothetical protein